MRVHFVVHESFEAPGAYETWVKERGCTATYSRVYTGEALPDEVEDIDLLTDDGRANDKTARFGDVLEGLTDGSSASCWSVRRIPTHGRPTLCGN